jgi:hypothetical protein
MREWVRNDLTGNFAIPRHLFRSMIPFLPVFAGIFLLLPGSPVLRGSAVLLPLILALIYSFAFMPMNRRRRLTLHGLSEDTENARQARRHERERVRYEQTWRHQSADPLMCGACPGQ